MLEASFALADSDSGPTSEDYILDILNLDKEPSLLKKDQLGGKGYKYLSEQWSQRDKTLGYKFKNPIKTREILRYEDTILYDKTYTIDGPLSRYIPQIQTKNHKERIVLMGCSYVFGVGLNDKETIMANLSAMLPDTKIQNISLIGSGPHITLASFENQQTSIDNKTEFLKDRYIYVFSEVDHVPRANGFMIPLKWLSDSPHYSFKDQNKDEEMTRDGTLAEYWPIKTRILSWLRDYIFFPLGVYREFPPIRDVHREYVCDLFMQIKKEIKKRNPKAEFFIYHFPFFEKPNNYYQECFSKRGLKSLPHRYINPDKLRIPHDNHPNHLGSKAIASDIIRAIKE